MRRRSTGFERRKLDEQRGMKRLLSRAAIRLTGENVAAFLQGVVTQDIERVAPGAAAFSCLLTPQGKILFDFLVHRREADYVIDIDRAAADDFRKRLLMYRLRAKVTIEAADDLMIVTGAGMADPRGAGLPARTVAPLADMAPGDDAFDAERLACGVPAFGRDFGADEMFLLDVNYDLLAGVNYQKGCFVGQEVTSRMKRKGEVRRRTLVARFDGPPPQAGAPVTAGEAEIGAILSGRDGVALALIRLDRLARAQEDAGAVFTAGGLPLQLAFPSYFEQGQTAQNASARQ